MKTMNTVRIGSVGTLEQNLPATHTFIPENKTPPLNSGIQMIASWSWVYMRDVCGIIQGVTGKEIKPIYLIKAFGLLMEDSEVGRQEKPQDRNVLYNYIDPDAGILRLNTARPPLDQNSLVPQGWSGTVISFIRQGMIGVERDMELPPLLIGHFQDGSTKHVHRNGRWNWKIQGIARKPKTDAEKSIHWNVFKL